MKLVIQRVIQSNLTIDKKTYSSIGYGMVIFIGISEDDNECFLNKTASKVSKLRIFNDEFGKMNKNINDINGEILLVSQFTLYADTKKEIAQALSKLPNQKMLLKFIIVL